MQLSKAQSAFQYFQRFGRAMLVLIALVLSTAFLTSMHTRPVSATTTMGPAVMVANTPLPVTGNVNATITGTVGISGPVNLGSTGTLPVTATGDPAASGFTPVSQLGGGGFRSGQCAQTFDNPASTGQILVVESVGAYAVLPTGQKVQSMFVIGAGISGGILMPTYQVDDGTNAVFGASQAMRSYIPAGQSLIIYINQTKASDSGSCSMSYSGYLVNVR